MLKAMIEETWPRGVIFVLDGKHGKARRKSIYSEYKANRDDKNKQIDWDAIYTEIRDLEQILPKFGIGVTNVEGLEADDSIYLLTTKLNNRNKTVQIVSSDSDLYQLISQFNSVYLISNKKRLTLENFEQTIGVSVDRFIDYKVIVGDASDNIKGIAGIGDKTASSLLSSTTLDKAVEIVQTGRLKALNSAEAITIIARNRALIDLAFANRGVDIEMPIVPIANKVDMQSILDNLGFFSMLDKFDEFSRSFSSLRTGEVLYG
jgi:DNA polymerase-1